MDFRDATDRLCEKVSHEDLAKEIGVSLQGVRQARLPDGAASRRQPPQHWPSAIIRLAEKQIMRNRRLIEEVRAGMSDKK